MIFLFMFWYNLSFKDILISLKPQIFKNQLKIFENFHQNQNLHIFVTDKNKPLHPINFKFAIYLRKFATHLYFFR